MSIDPGGASDDPAATPPKPLKPGQITPGELLRQGREQRGLSVQQVADELHLDVRLINALESNDFQLLGVPVYAKGHLRKYASLLGLSPDTVITHYQSLSDIPVAPQVVPAVTPPQLRPRVSLRVPLWIVVGAVVAAGLLWLAGQLLDRLQPGEPGPASAPVESVVPEGTLPQLDMESAQEAVIEPEEAETPPAAAAVAPADAPVAGSVSLRLQFSAASWTEIRDARGRRLMYGVGQPGETRTLSGEPPLQVTLGVAAAVAMQVNDQSVPVPRRAGKDAAYFTVAADGLVR